jgi:peptide/nickel transport system substrate-binding protein
VASIAGYRDIASVKGSNNGRTVTVKFRTPFADWQMLFANLLPAHIMEKVGVEPRLHHGQPGHRPLGRAVPDRQGVGPEHRAEANPKWWGTKPNVRRITVHIASDSASSWQVGESGYVQVALPSSITPAFLTR